MAFIEPFPKIKSHGSESHGVLATPTDTEHGQSKLFNIQYLISEKATVVVFRRPEEGVLSRSKLKSNKVFFVEISRVLVDDFQMTVSELSVATNKETV